MQVILEDIWIYFGRFLMPGFCRERQKQKCFHNITGCNV